MLHLVTKQFCDTIVCKPFICINFLTFSSLANASFDNFIASFASYMNVDF